GRIRVGGFSNHAAVAELLARPGTPAPIVLDEAIEIARRYGSEESGAFVNGVLDQVARRLRPGELE
ncbi:MAG TPA: transcription antitermination factor NusB, partial [Terriglobales bacterium]|nr:transcription antitermination factor NusB [Terriglobales bacterium]